jgi:type I restriction enzyme S subunit
MTGSTRGNLNAQSYANLKIPMKSTDEQSHIVDILGTLDEKIENIEQKIQTLLKICELEYKALISGKCYNACLADIASVESGKRPITKESVPSNTINIPIIGASDIMGYTNNILFDEPILVIGRVGTHGIVQPVFKSCWASDNTLVIKSNYYAYVYNILKNIDYSSINKGSTQPLITQTDIRNTPVYIPELNELRSFEEKHSMFLIQTYKDQIEKTQEIKNLFLQKFFG